MHVVSCRVVVCSWCIIVHALCKRYLLLYSWVIMLSLLCWDICECDWNDFMLEVSYQIVISGWCIVMLLLSERHLLFLGRVTVYHM